MTPKPLQDLTNFFIKFPGIGPRQAGRFSFFLMKQPREEIDNFIEVLRDLKQNVSICSDCYLPIEKSEKNLCGICSDTTRNKSIICVVEKENDALNMEKIKLHDGVYLVLGQNISPMHESPTAKIRLKKLLTNVKNQKNQITEIILSLNNTREGNFTSLYIQELFKKNSLDTIKLSRLGRGLSTGSELEYADEETLRNALEGRK